MNKQQTKKVSASLRQEGMTLVEIMIVLAIVALMAAGVGFAIIPMFSKGKVKQTETDVKAIRSAALLWVSDNNGCPTMQNLIEDKYLDKKQRTTDAWDNEFAIECEDDDVDVYSAGPDGELGNDDDIPEAEGAE